MPDKAAVKRLSDKEKEQLINKLTKEMQTASKMLEFEHAAFLRDRIKEIREGKDNAERSNSHKRRKSKQS